MRYYALLFCLLAAMPAGAQSGDWTSFRGGPALTGSLPTTITFRPRPLWRYYLGSAVECTAAIAGDTVYVGNRAGRLAALNLSNGKLRWHAQGPAGFTSSPLIANGTLYIGDEGGVFYAVNPANGKTRWRYKTATQIMSSPTLAGDKVLFGSYDGYLYCLNARNGRLKWRFKTGAQVHCTPCVVGDRVIISGCDGVVRLIDLATGKQRSRTVLSGANFGASAAASAGQIFVGALNGDYLSLRLPSGKLVWRRDERLPGAGFYASAAATPNAVVYASRSHRVYRLDRATGLPMWTFQAGGDIDSSPVIAGDVVYFGSDDGSIYGLNLANGRQVWQFRAGQSVKSSPAIGHDRMVIGVTDGMIYCFGR